MAKKIVEKKKSGEIDHSEIFSSDLSKQIMKGGGKKSLKKRLFNRFVHGPKK